ncbi:hypothetical protein DFQ27_001744 [Actinomortierella ambigua]|uniref:Uncharacterized protein n=1 Tax=Actinomortierella ambigua TaxID=1343610 RepID=A0A9P6U821_9FUNG|nr:hypothetical protein DFQ27_001744 [Actinomortierella ambigua]
MDRKRQHGRDRDDMRRDAKSIYNRLRSIEADAEFVSEIADMFPQFPVIVDSTRKGKRVPDALSKTVPIWCATINTAVQRVATQLLEEQQRLQEQPNHKGQSSSNVNNVDGDFVSTQLLPAALDKEKWDTRFHSLPSLVSRSEHAQIAERISGFADKLIRFTDLKPLVQRLSKPLRPLWLTPQSVLFADNLPDYSTVDFLPVICLSASAIGQDGFEERDGYLYVQGSGDDEEMWGKGLKPDIFWEHKDWILDDGITPEECDERVVQVVQTHRQKVLKDEEARRQQQNGMAGEKKAKKGGNSSSNKNHHHQDRPLFTPSMELCTSIAPGPLWIGNHVSGRIPEAWEAGFDLVINCGAEIQRDEVYEMVQAQQQQQDLAEAEEGAVKDDGSTIHVEPIGDGGATLCVVDYKEASTKGAEAAQRPPRRRCYLHLPIPEGKKGQYKMLEMIPVAIQVVKDFYHHCPPRSDHKDDTAPRILVHCKQGMDRSVGITLALLVACYDEETGEFRPEILEEDMTTITSKTPSVAVNKEIIQRRLFQIMSHRLAARPSRATLKMVNTYFMSPTKEEKATLRPSWMQ